MLSQSDEAIAECRAHLTRFEVFNTVIESYLVRYLLVVICAEVEKQVLKMVVERARRAGDGQVASFVDNVVAKQFRRIRTGEMAGLLKKFDPILQEQFHVRIDQTPAQVAFDNIVNNRHNMAHGRSTVNMTFEELCRDVDSCKIVLTHFSEVLGLS